MEDCDNWHLLVWFSLGFGGGSPHRARRAQQPPAGRTAPERCISAPLDLRSLSVPGFPGLVQCLRRPRQTGEGNQKRFDFLAIHLSNSRKDTLQNGPAPDQPVCSGPVFLDALAVPQNLLAVLKLLDLLGSFFFFCGNRLDQFCVHSSPPLHNKRPPTGFTR